MARTYWSEGRNVANGVRALLVLGSMSFYFYVVNDKSISLFFGFLLTSIVISEIVGRAWTNKRRKSVAARKKTRSSTGSKNKGDQNKKLSEQDLLKASIDSLSGTDFERLMEMYYKDHGYQVERIGGSGDHEVDLILKGKDGYKIAVQCKRWKKDVGNDIVLRLKAGKQVHGCYDAWIVTTSYFTKAAEEAASRLNIRLINRLVVLDMIQTWKKEKKRA